MGKWNVHVFWRFSSQYHNLLWVVPPSICFIYIFFLSKQKSSGFFISWRHLVWYIYALSTFRQFASSRMYVQFDYYYYYCIGVVIIKLNETFCHDNEMYLELFIRQNSQKVLSLSNIPHGYLSLWRTQTYSHHINKISQTQFLFWLKYIVLFNSI